MDLLGIFNMARYGNTGDTFMLIYRVSQKYVTANQLF